MDFCVCVLQAGGRVTSFHLPLHVLVLRHVDRAAGAETERPGNIQTVSVGLTTALTVMDKDFCKN